MKILQVFNQYLELGGEEEWVNQLLLLSGGSYEIVDLRFHSGAWIGRGAPNPLKQAFLIWSNPTSRKILRETVLREKPDLLLFHNLVPVASLGLYEEAALLRVPVVQYVHNFRPFSPSGTLWANGRIIPQAMTGNPWPEVFGRIREKSFLRTFLLAFWQKQLFRSGHLNVVKSWITVSDFMRHQFINAGFPPERVSLLRHCWIPRDSSRTAPEANHYLFLGRLVAEKGPQVALGAWRILEQRLGDKCPYLIVAGSGPDSARIHASIAELTRVKCVGFVSGVTKESLLEGCRALIAPSIWWEPLGLIIYEAYDFSRPVLAARSGGLSETVIEGETGYLHSPGDCEALANDIERMERLGEAGRRELGIAGNRWLRENASPENWKQKFLTILQGATENLTKVQTQ